MAFASRADLLARSNARRLAQLAMPADRAMPPDDAFRIAIAGGSLSACSADDRASIALGLDAVDKALADADALILTYGIPESARNTLLARIASTIALYYLQGAERMTEDVRKAYQDALDLLKAHARGDNNLIPATPPPADTVNDQAIIYSSPPRYGAGVDGGVGS